MTILRFIHPWGPYRPGDLRETGSKTTVYWLVDVYKLAVIEPMVPAQAEPIPEPERDLSYKYVRKPPKDKMVKGPKAAK